MSLVRYVVPALVAGLLWAPPLDAQVETGAVAGQVTDSVTRRPLLGVEISVQGMMRRTITDQDGRFTLTGVPVGPQIVQTALIGYGQRRRAVSVAAGAVATVEFALRPQAALLEAVVVTGYGTQRREAITGSVSTIEATGARSAMVTNLDQMVQGRAAGVQLIQNNGEPGAGVQIRIRGGSSISATNEPLYVIDGVPINNVATEPNDVQIGGPPSLPRNPLNMLNPGDIASITVLKDAAAASIYGSRASNGVILVETKKGRSAAGPTIEYETYAATSSAARKFDVLNGAEYRAFVQQQVQAGKLDPALLAGLGPANTNWADAITRRAVSHSHNLAFTGGSEATRYRASLNYLNEQGVTISSGLERVQGRLNATHQGLDGRLRLGVNVTTSRVNNTYLTYETRGGFEGGVFQNVATFNPTQPVTVTDSTGTRFYEVVGSTSVRNPVALANQITNIGHTTRNLANASADFDVATGLTAKVVVGLDQAVGQRQQYYPAANPVGRALGGGFAQQADVEGSTQTLQTTLTYQRPFGDNTVDFVGGYEFQKIKRNAVTSRGVGFFTDAFSFNNLNAASIRNTWSEAQEERLVGFFSRANVGIKDRYFVTGVLRYDGSSKFAQGHKWGVFPGLSASWRLSQESFMAGGPFSDLRLRLGWGRQGNPSIRPYTTLITLAGGSDGTYPWGDTPQGGVTATSNGNPDLKWETTSQIDGAVDFAILDNRVTGTVEYYVKNTRDLLLTIDVPQPALASTQLRNVGKTRNSGVEVSLDALAMSRPGLTWRAGLVFAAERHRVKALSACEKDQVTGKETCPFIPTGATSGQGQSDQPSQRIMPGQPLGTFFGPVFTGWDAQGRQIFKCSSATTGCTNGRTVDGLGPASADYEVIGNANPDFSVGLHSDLSWGRFDVSLLIRASVGQDVFNNTALVYSTKSDALQGKNFLRPALTDPTGITEPAIYSSRWVESGSFVRLQNITVGYDLNLPVLTRSARSARVFVSADNLLLLTGYSGLDPEVHSEAGGLANRGIDYLNYPRPRTVTGGVRVTF